MTRAASIVPLGVPMRMVRPLWSIRVTGVPSRTGTVPAWRTTSVP